jgi:hypothetical protein
LILTSTPTYFLLLESSKFPDVHSGLKKGEPSSTMVLPPLIGSPLRSVKTPFAFGEMKDGLTGSRWQNPTRGTRRIKKRKNFMAELTGEQ